MKKTQHLMLFLSVLIYSCNTNMKQDSIENWKNEIINTEQAFAEMAMNEGIPKAFLTYAANDVVLLRNNKLIIGIESLRESYKNKESEIGKVSLTWKPDFVDVALSGDLGYTYGKYVYTTTDSIGTKNVVEGIFHTVWKRQPDGTWKFVWD
jgi:ketosteroid isomerase-like protein